MAREVRSVYFVDGARTPFGKAGKKGIFAETRADDLVASPLVRTDGALGPASRQIGAISMTFLDARRRVAERIRLVQEGAEQVEVTTAENLMSRGHGHVPTARPTQHNT